MYALDKPMVTKRHSLHGAISFGISHIYLSAPVYRPGARLYSIRSRRRTICCCFSRACICNYDAFSRLRAPFCCCFVRYVRAHASMNRASRWERCAGKLRNWFYWLGGEVHMGLGVGAVNGCLLSCGLIVVSVGFFFFI